MSIRGSKRQRLSEARSDVDSPRDKHQQFTTWAKDRGVEIRGVKAARLPGRGLGLVTTKRIRDGDRVLFVPERAMFSPDSVMLKREALNRPSLQAQLTISAMLAFRDSKSPMKLWEDTWPTVDDFEQSMPMCWPQNLQQLLPSPVYQPLERQLADYQKDWTVAKRIFDERGISESEFKYYWMIVNSRSFHWKQPRGTAGSMVMCPFIDYMNHGPSGSGCNVRQTAKGYEVIADRVYEPGEETLATYGAHSNNKLLVHYGFICSHTLEGPSIDDDIRLDHLILPKLNPDIQSQLQDVGFLGAYALLPANNELCFKTQVAVRAAILTCNEWEYFVTNGEDLSVDYTTAVNDFVKKLLVEYRGLALGKISELRGLGNSTAKGTLSLRWTQIIDAIDAFDRA